MKLATVLYEDSKIGRDFPLHHLILRMTEDDINGETWRLRQCVLDNPRNGVDLVLKELPRTKLVAGTGKLFVLVDRDRIVQHINQMLPRGQKAVPSGATDDVIVNALRGFSNAPEQLEVFLLYPNMEGLMATIAQCAPGQWTEQLALARKKVRTARDAVLSAVATATNHAVRKCIREHQPGLDGLARALAALIPKGSIQ
jgi:hypothetical protein